jgi:hypothetical protein
MDSSEFVVLAIRNKFARKAASNGFGLRPIGLPLALVRTHVCNIFPLSFFILLWS